MRTTVESYLLPYVRAARRHGASFDALLWASPASQRKRFEAICRVCDLSGRSILDAGCGRGDFAEYLIERGIERADYTGLEAIGPLADAAAGRRFPNSRILRGDFILDPARLFVGADVVIFCGSLNTMPDDLFYSTLSRARDAAASMLVFNFLCSEALAGRSWLTWRRVESVLGFLRQFDDEIQVVSDYLPGDCTIAVTRSGS